MNYPEAMAAYIPHGNRCTILLLLFFSLCGRSEEDGVLSLYVFMYRCMYVCVCVCVRMCLYNMGCGRYPPLEMGTAVESWSLLMRGEEKKDDKNSSRGGDIMPKLLYGTWLVLLGLPWYLLSILDFLSHVCRYGA